MRERRSPEHHARQGFVSRVRSTGQLPECCLAPPPTQVHSLNTFFRWHRTCLGTRSSPRMRGSDPATSLRHRLLVSLTCVLFAHSTALAEHHVKLRSAPILAIALRQLQRVVLRSASVAVQPVRCLRVVSVGREFRSIPLGTPRMQWSGLCTSRTHPATPRLEPVRADGPSWLGSPRSRRTSSSHSSIRRQPARLRPAPRPPDRRLSHRSASLCPLAFACRVAIQPRMRRTPR